MRVSLLEDITLTLLVLDMKVCLGCFAERDGERESGGGGRERGERDRESERVRDR